MGFYYVLLGFYWVPLGLYWVPSDSIGFDWGPFILTKPVCRYMHAVYYALVSSIVFVILKMYQQMCREWRGPAKLQKTWKQ